MQYLGLAGGIDWVIITGSWQHLAPKKGNTMSLFKKVSDAVHHAVEQSSTELARIDPGPAVANLASQIGEDGKEAVLKQAQVLAQATKDTQSATDNQSCRIIVIAGLGAWAATEASVAPWKAALTAGGGAAAAQIACDRVFPPG